MAEHKPVKIRSVSKTGDRTHRKIITVDGRIGFTGGLAIDDRWTGNARNRDEWCDTVVRLEGPVVLQLHVCSWKTGSIRPYIPISNQPLSG